MTIDSRLAGNPPSLEATKDAQKLLDEAKNDSLEAPRNNKGLKRGFKGGVLETSGGVFVFKVDFCLEVLLRQVLVFTLRRKDDDVSKRVQDTCTLFTQKKMWMLPTNM